MKITTLLLLSITSVPAFAQQPTAFSVTGGVESHSPYFTGLFKPYASGWNAGVQFNNALKNTSRWTKELGVSIGIAEYNGPEKRIEEYDTMPQMIQHGSIIAPGYVKREEVYYSNYTFLRLSGGVNYVLKENEKWRFSTGLSVVAEFRLKYREHGKGVLVPVYGQDTLPVIYYDFNYKGSDNISDVGNMDFLIQPHVDVFYHVNDKLSATLRLAYFQSVFHWGKFVAQLNAGVSYQLSGRE